MKKLFKLFTSRKKDADPKAKGEGPEVSKRPGSNDVEAAVKAIRIKDCDLLFRILRRAEAKNTPFTERTSVMMNGSNLLHVRCVCLA